MAKSGKGSRFERWFCKALSLWWTEGMSDCAFWRTAGSGGRATVRGRKGKATTGAYGDIMATDDIGIPFLECVTLELKRGYARYTLHDMLDRPSKGAVQQYEFWFLQAQESARYAGTPAWMVVTQRDRREALVFLPGDVVNPVCGCYPYVLLRAKVGDNPGFMVHGTTLSAFFAQVKPLDFKIWAEAIRMKK